MSALRDLRAYFQRGGEACLAERRTPGMHPAQLGYQCTLTKGHDGKHIAHDLDGTLITAWAAS